MTNVFQEKKLLSKINNNISSNNMTEEIKTPRVYQLELCLKAMEKNSIIFLGTGSGKTFIATMMIRELSHSIMELKKKTVFLVNNVALVSQQAQFLKLNTNLRVASMCGADGVDFWQKEKWLKVISDCDILVMIHQIFLDILNRGYMHMSSVNLLVIDECHHTIGNSPYMQIMRTHYFTVKETNPEMVPLIVGLSASIVACKASLEKFLKLKQDLEFSLDSKVITVPNMSSYVKYVTQPNEAFLEYEAPEDINTMNGLKPTWYCIIETGLEDIEKLLENRIDKWNNMEDIDYIAKAKAIKCDKSIFSSYKKLLNRLCDALEQLGIYCGHKICQMHLKDDNLIFREMNASDEFEIDLIKSVDKTLNDISNFCNTKLETIDSVSNRIEIFSSKKILALFALLAQYSPNSQCKDCLFDDTRFFEDEDSVISNHDKRIKMTAIVFVQQRQTAMVLAGLIHELAEADSTFKFLKVDFVVGQDTNLKSEVMSERTKSNHFNLTQTLKRFREGDINIIVSTSALEEGMDISKCNLVVRFDGVSTFRSYIQSKGRARAKTSRFIVMHDNVNKLNVQRTVEEFRQIEVMAIDAIHNEGDELEDESSSESRAMGDFYLSRPDEFFTSPRITEYSAIQLVNLYVQTLPTDKFTTLTCFWEFKRVKSKPSIDKLQFVRGDSEHELFCCYLHFPHLSVFHEPIKGLEKRSKIEAKRSAALVACELLHKSGCLDDNLLPIRYRKVKIDGLFEDDEDDNRKANEPKRGTKKNRLFYKIKKASEIEFLQLPPSVAYTNIFIYKIKLYLSKPATATQNIKRYKSFNSLTQNSSLGIIVKHSLPPAALIPMNFFTIYGTITANLECLGPRTISTVSLQPDSAIFDFHVFLCREALSFVPLWVPHLTNFIELSPLFIPLLENHDYDWRLICKISDYSKVSVNNDIMRDRADQFEFQSEQYHDAVLKCSYKTDNDLRYLIEEIVYDMSPESYMPHSTTTFAKHFASKYNCKITNNSQPLLRISNADKRYHMLRTVLSDESAATVNQNSINMSREEFLSKRSLFIPETMSILPISASLWRQAQLLPFMFERVQTLLKVEKFRQRIIDQSSYFSSFSTNAEDSFLLDFGEVSRSLEHFFDYESHKIGISHVFPSTSHMLPALTLTSANEMFDLERLEILGDSFLKFSTSVYLYQSLGDRTEGELTMYRSLIVGNKNLCRLAINIGLPDVIQAQKFEPYRNWMPPNFYYPPGLEELLIEWEMKFRSEKMFDNSKHLIYSRFMDVMVQSDFKRLSEIYLDEECKNIFYDEIIKRHLGVTKNATVSAECRLRNYVDISDKSLADSVEAIIGCFLLHLGHVGALNIMSWMGLHISSGNSIKNLLQKEECVTPKCDLKLPDPPNSAFYCASLNGLEQFRYNQIITRIQVDQIEAKIGYVFKETSFLLQALTHSSYSTNKLTPSYERLEFLGDAVLDYLVTLYIYTKYPTYPPGRLTDARSALVDNVMLASLTLDNKLENHLLHLSPGILRKINEYREDYFILKKNFESSSEPETASAYKKKAKLLLKTLKFYTEEECPVLTDIEVPKVLGDIFESIIGAVFLDSKYDLDTVWKVYIRLCPSVDNIILNKPKNFVAKISEIFPGNVTFGAPKVLDKISRVSIILNICDLNIKRSFRGIGSNKKSAKLAAAKCAMRILNLFN